MSNRLDSIEALELWRQAVCEGVRQDTPDLSARQMAVLMTVYLKAFPHTVRGLAEDLNIAKPAVSRALNRLEELDLIRRKKDAQDRRSILIQRTVKGSVFLSDFSEIIIASAAKIKGLHR